MTLHRMLLVVSVIAAELTAMALSGFAQSPQLNPGSQGLNPNAVGSQPIAPPVSGNFGVTSAPGTLGIPGYAPGAAPSSGVAGGAGPGLSSGAPFSGTGYGTNSIGRTPEAGATIPFLPAPGAQPGALRPGGTTTSPALGSGIGPGSPGPSMGTTPSSGAIAPGAGAGTGGGAGGGR